MSSLDPAPAFARATLHVATVDPGQTFGRIYLDRYPDPHAVIEPTSRLYLVDLRGDGCVRMGIPSDVPRNASQALARRWSLAFYQHSSAPDGIIYSSRLNEEMNLAIYDRAIMKLREVDNTALVDAPRFAEVLDDLRVAIAS